LSTVRIAALRWAGLVALAALALWVRFDAEPQQDFTAPPSASGGRSGTPISAGPAPAPAGSDHELRDKPSDRDASALIEADAAGQRDTVLRLITELTAKAAGGDSAALASLVASLYRLPQEKRRYLMKALGRVGTPDALEQLLKIARSEDPRAASLRPEALEEIRRIGTHLTADGEYPEELSPLLEQQLPTAVAPDWLRAIAGGLSSVGSASGLEALLRNGETTGEPSAIRTIAEAVRSVRNPHAVPPLARQLQADPDFDHAITWPAAEALAAISHPDATKALLNWAAGAAGPAAVQRAARLFGALRDAESVTLLGSAAATRRFADPQMAATVDTVARSLALESQPQIDTGGLGD
jgi:hypothetical protein